MPKKKIEEKDNRLLQIIINDLKDLKKVIDTNEVNRSNDHKMLTERVDKLGLHLAYVDDNSPSREEFEEL